MAPFIVVCPLTLQIALTIRTQKLQCIARDATMLTNASIIAVAVVVSADVVQVFITVEAQQILQTLLCLALADRRVSVNATDGQHG